SHTNAWPLVVFCQRMSLLLSALKSWVAVNAVRDGSRVGVYTRMQPFASTAPRGTAEHRPLVAALLVGTSAANVTGPDATESAFELAPVNSLCAPHPAASITKSASPPGACRHAPKYLLL